jgi:hypothetical protein
MTRRVLLVLKKKGMKLIISKNTGPGIQDPWSLINLSF